MRTTASDNEYAGIRVGAESWKGRGDGAAGTVVRDDYSTGNGVSGLRLDGTVDTIVTNLTATDDRYGVWGNATTGSRLEGSAVDGNAVRDFLWTNGSIAGDEQTHRGETMT